jgi:pyrroloquinoline-quinone synthase
MNAHDFFAELDRRIAQYDLLCHPFYQAWNEGKLTREDLREYAAAYFKHVEAFPEYLDMLRRRLPEGEARLAVTQNMQDEEGIGSTDGRAHHELWLDFAEGMGADREEVRRRRCQGGVGEAMEYFFGVSDWGAPAEAVAAFYAYESQVPRVAAAKEKGLKELYGADKETCAYFTLHKIADVHHSNVWRNLLEQELQGGADPKAMLQSAEDAAQVLWRALDSIEAERQARMVAA